MQRLAFGLALLLTALGAAADEAGECRAGAGSYLTGVVVGAPRFAHGRFRKGIELSHTHLRLRADGDGQVYDVAIDNVFATGYASGQRGIPAPLDAIRLQDRLGVCGALYTRGAGIHWVHPNCGRRPNPNQPNGWLKRLGPDGAPGANVEGNTTFCPLFQNGFSAP
ncbi:MAG: hypothetical protein ACJ8LG_06055 [Massilia sp.]